MEEIFYEYEEEYKQYTQDVLMETIIVGMEDMIMNQFKQYGKYGGTYSNTLINTKINSILNSKFNKNTTTRIFNHLFKSNRSGRKINDKFINVYKIIGVK